MVVVHINESPLIVDLPRMNESSYNGDKTMNRVSCSSLKVKPLRLKFMSVSLKMQLVLILRCVRVSCDAV